MMSGEFDLSEDEGCEESDLCCGYGDLSNDLDKLYVSGGGSYDPDSIVGTAVDGSKPNATEDDFAPEMMPVDFYQSVEVFLAKAPPRLSDCMSKVPKFINKKHDKESDAPGLMFPRLVPPIRVRNNEVTPPEPPLKASKVKSKIYNDAKKGSRTQQVQIDHHLLQEAFAYTEMLIKNATEEETMEYGAVGIARDTATHKVGSNPVNKPSDRTKSVSAPNHHEISSSMLESAYGDGRPPLRKHVGHTGSSHKSGAAVGVVKKLRSRSQASTITATAAAFDADNHSIRGEAFRVAVEAEVDPRKNAVDFDDLVANFQDGITLHKLRRDLEESKRSMKRSEDFLRQLSKDFLHGVTY